MKLAIWVNVMFHTTDRPGVFATPGTLPVEMTNFFATDLIDVEGALRARRRVLETTRANLEFIIGFNSLALNFLDGNFIILITCASIVVKIYPLEPCQAKGTGDLPSL